MKNLMYLCLLGLFVAGCSKSEEKSQIEQLGQDLAGQMKASIEKAAATRDVELPK